jgi:SAM-dependent methyltransferase
MTSHRHGAPDHGTAHAHPAPVPPQSEEEWDEWYAGSQRVWSGRPNGALVAEVDGLRPGRALDVGCGEGADAVWLAAQGWDVTALDVSAVALDRARSAAGQAGVTVTWLHAGLVDSPVTGDRFDLVSVHYPALRRTPGHDAERALLATVAPGGILLAVFHADLEGEGAAAHGLDPDDYVGHDHLAALLDDGWRVETDARRPRNIQGGSGADHVEDLVLKARRLPER